MEKKGILLFSGGLDSLLAAKVLMEQDIELIALNFILPFISPDIDLKELASTRYAESIGLGIKHFRLGLDYMKMVEYPPHGYGKNINPCIDCKIYFLKKAEVLMKEVGASFVATGEVVGQRPMSQMRNMLNHIEKESGLTGYLLRPLSAKLLKPTVAENMGIVNRELLHDINGRSRNVQMDLAEKYKIDDYASPAGGCLFTDKNIAKRVRDLFDNVRDYNTDDVYLLTIGRHYRLHEKVKVIVSRNEQENIKLEKFFNRSDYYVIPEFRGPAILVRGQLRNNDFNTIASISRRYGKPDTENNMIIIKKADAIVKSIPAESAISDTVLDIMRV